MADSGPSPNNQLVRYRGRPIKERSMPNVSQAQRGAMAEAAEGKSNLGIPKKVGEEFMDADEGGKLPPKAPKKTSNLKKQGLVSDEALAKAKKKLGVKEDAIDRDDDEANGE